MNAAMLVAPARQGKRRAPTVWTLDDGLADAAADQVKQRRDDALGGSHLGPRQGLGAATVRPRFKR
jgi:hypothetical protein